MSVRSGVLTLLHTACGAGVLAIPYAFRPFGLVFGVVLIVFCGMCSFLGLVLQTEVAGYVPPSTASFASLTQLINPRLSVVFDLAIAVKCFGVAVSYMIVVGDVSPQLFGAVSGSSVLASRVFHISVVMCVLVTPLCFLRDLKSLKYASMLAISSVVYLCVLVGVHAVWPGENIEKGPVHWFLPFKGDNPLSTLPIFVFAYTCHHNMFSIINEQQTENPAKIKLIPVYAMLLAALLYIVIGTTGYWTFGDNVTGNIIILYPTTTATTIARIAMVIVVTLAFPLQCHPARASISNLIDYFGSKSSLTSEETNLVEQQDEEAIKTIEISRKRFVAITSAILITAYLLAISVKSLAHVLAIVGATGSTSISFILPGVFGYKLIGSKHEIIPTNLRILRWLAFALTVWGIFVMVASLTAALYLGAGH